MDTGVAERRNDSDRFGPKVAPRGVMQDILRPFAVPVYRTVVLPGRWTRGNAKNMTIIETQRSLDRTYLPFIRSYRCRYGRESSDFFHVLRFAAVYSPLAVRPATSFYARPPKVMMICSKSRKLILRKSASRLVVYTAGAFRSEISIVSQRIRSILSTDSCWCVASGKNLRANCSRPSHRIRR